MSRPHSIINTMVALPAAFENSTTLSGRSSITYPNSSPQSNENSVRQEESDEMIERMAQLEYLQPCQCNYDSGEEGEEIDYHDSSREYLFSCDDDRGDLDLSTDAILDSVLFLALRMDGNRP